MIEQGAPVDVLVKFWKRLKENPSKESRESLYAFLEFNHVPLLPDGCFLAYKKVRKNFMDCHSGTIDNSPGRSPEMDRSKVDPHRHNTCSHGLHVAAYRYAAHSYGGGGDILLDVKVDPKDVVTVPPDYNQQKMRVCKYTVICVHEEGGEIKKQVVDKKPEQITRMTLKSTRGFVPIINACTEDLLEIDHRKPVYVISTDPRSRFLLITQDGSRQLDNLHFVQKFGRGKPVYATKEALEATKIGGFKYF